MHLRKLNIGCFGGGTGLPSLLGGLKANPWLTVNAVVTMFDSGGSSGQLRDELGVLPPGDVLKCALALARNEREARRVLLSRLPMLEHARLRGHTGGNLLLSMMEQYSGDFLAAVDGLRALLGCAGRVWPVSVEKASLCAEYGDGTTSPRRGGGRRRAERRQRASRVSGSSRRSGSTRRRRARSRGSRRRSSVRAASTPACCQSSWCAARPRRSSRSRAGDPGDEPADRRARHVALHCGRSGAADERRRSAARSTWSSSTPPAVGGDPGALPRGAQEAARARRRARRRARS